MSDPLTAASVSWLNQFGGIPPAAVATAYAFGKLRQANSIKLLTAAEPGYIGLTTLDTPERLFFIAAQDGIAWGQQLTSRASMGTNAPQWHSGTS